jgi:putative tricarboxylic transport membrane protein
VLEGIAPALSALTNPYVAGFVVLGALIGLLAGVLPGLGNVQAMTVALPFTFGMDRLTAIYFLCAIASSSTFGGSVPAILLNIPGTPANAATTIEGYPMARRGEANRALAISATGSALGGLVGIVVLIAAIPVVRLLTLAFGPPETFMLVLLGLVTIAYAVQRNIVRGLATAGIGMLISLIGYSEVTGIYRFSLASPQYLWDGIQDVPFLVGVFGLSEAIRYGMQGGAVARAGEVTQAGFRGTLQGVIDVLRYPVTFARSCVVGAIVGIAPGIGGSVSNVVAYAMTAQMSKDPEIGKGSVEGLIAAETANNATIGGDAVPTLAFGIPGSAAMAVLLGALTLHGVAVGPWLMKEHMELVWVVVFGLVAGTILSSLVGFFVARWLARLTVIPMGLLVPVVIVLILAGSFAVRQNFWDMLVSVASGVLGYFLTRHGFSLLPLIIGFLLGAPAELAFIQSLHISQGSPLIFFIHPLSLALFLGAVAVGFYPVLQCRRMKGAMR